ncbi:hypothetical protein RHSIM_Rhsim07G0220400 [Rhododendron simsii]|uniref:RING-type domain-containing protein n=1 Tax=Rhododendron simsii TaxID=118357 RepID=A0A834LJA0_RHOSS|nr:hypothetical protein RHSIM_Rhsim07G0220400 [Rhododendron simsii]
MHAMIHPKRPLDLPPKFTKVFERHPGIFYISKKSDTQTVVLKEAYDRQQLIQKHPLVDTRARYSNVMQQGFLDRSSGLYKRSVSAGLEVGLKSICTDDLSDYGAFGRVVSMDYDYKVTKKAGSLYDDDQRGVEDNIIRETINLAHSLENDTVNKAINVKVIIRPQDVGESNSDEDEEDYEQSPKEPTPASEEAIEALEILMLEAPEQCAICLTTLHVGESGTRLPCNHTYHYNCIVHWLRLKNTCPQCCLQLPTDPRGN